MDHIFNTYSYMTVKRILEVYGFDLSEHDFYLWAQTKDSLYHKMLYTPMALVMISVIYDQAKDFQSMCTKILLEYLTSPAADKDESSPGASIRFELEELRQKLVTDGEGFHNLELKYKRFITTVQKFIINVASALKVEIDSNSSILAKSMGFKSNQESKQAIETALALLSFTKSDNHAVFENINLRLANPISQDKQPEFLETINNLIKNFEQQEDHLLDFKQQAIKFYNAVVEERNNFMDALMHAHKLLATLPDYFFDAEAIQEKLQEIDFDKTIGVELV